MDYLREWIVRIAGIFRRGDRGLESEVDFHLDMLIEEHRRRGLSETDARAAAIRSFGGVIQMKESYRDQRSVPAVETLLQDARYAVRGLLRTKGFTAAALVTLALGIGANTAIFSVVNSVLLRPLDYSEPGRILQMHRSQRGLWAGQTGRRYMFFRDQMQSFEALAAWRGTAFNLVTGDSAEYVTALAVSKEYFTVFGGKPLYGRVFEPVEDTAGGPPAVILTHGLWRRMFNSDPSVIGRSVSLGDRSYPIVGVMPAKFDAIRTAELYVPLVPSTTGPGGGLNYAVAGRLKEHVSREQANAESATVFAAYQASLPNANFEGEFSPAFIPYQEGLSRGVRPALLAMLGAVGMLLLIACANTANLLLARASSRGREISVRAALGASRGRILGQLLTESVLLFVAGGGLGIALAYWSVPALLSLMPSGYLPFENVTIDRTVLAVTLALSVCTGIIFGLIPALNLSRQDLVEAFKEDGTRTTAGRGSGWWRRSLVVGEVALCMLLLVGAGLLVQTFIKLRAVDPGFDPHNLLTARMSLMGERYSTAAAVNRLYDLGLERLRAIPGVRSAAVVNGVPIETGLNLNVDLLETEEVEFALTDWRYATADYFNTMGINIVQGRGFDQRDAAGAPPVAVVSEQFARSIYKGGSAIGRRIRVFRQDGAIEIVGVARDLREQGLSGPVPAVMYVPVAQTHDNAIQTSHGYFQVSWVLRADAVTPDLVRRVREELRSLDPRQPVTAFRSMDEIKARAMATETFQMALLVAFATVGLLLAAAGIYGLVAYSVSQRTRELGIRMALGAARSRILASVVRQGATLALAGVAVGVIAAMILTRTLTSMIFGVKTLDAATVAIVGILLLFVAIAASIVPAIRAVRLNPVAALRDN
jgi:putative ABC transport system permease protein